jgi:hypothetical protein
MMMTNYNIDIVSVNFVEVFEDLTLYVCILNCNTFLREVIATMNSNESKE